MLKLFALVLFGINPTNNHIMVVNGGQFTDAKLCQEAGAKFLNEAKAQGLVMDKLGVLCVDTGFEIKAPASL